MTQRWSRHQPIAILFMGVLVLDQFTKYLVSSFLLPGDSIPSWGIFHITYTTNTGSAFGLFPNQTFFLIIASVIGIAILALFYRSHPYSGPWFKVSLGLQLGGACGNLTDRALLGHVVDFIEVGWWPVFNIADASIVTGIIILAAMVFLAERGGQQPHEATLPGSRNPYIPEEWFYD